MCKIWTQEVKISKSYDRNKFTFAFFKGRVYIQCGMYCIYRGILSPFLLGNVDEIMRAAYGGVFMEALIQTKPSETCI